MQITKWCNFFPLIIGFYEVDKKVTTSLAVTNMLIISQLVIIYLFVNFNLIQGQDCPRPASLINGRTKIKQRGHFVIFKCYRPYTLVGSSKAMCINRCNWL